MVSRAVALVIPDEMTDVEMITIGIETVTAEGAAAPANIAIVDAEAVSYLVLFSVIIDNMNLTCKANLVIL